MDRAGHARLQPGLLLQDAQRPVGQQVHEPVDTGGQDQHGERHAQQRIDDGEGLAGVRQGRGVAISCQRKRRVRQYMEGEAQIEDGEP